MAEPVSSNINDAGSPVTGADRVNASPPSLPGMPPDDRLLPDRSNTRLNAAAEKVGGAVGSAVGSVRRARLRVVGGRRSSGPLGEMADPKGTMSDLADSASATVSDLKDSAAEKIDEFRDRASDLTQKAGERLGDLKSTAGDRMSDFSASARERIYYARRRANYLTNEYPVHTIVGFGALAFIVGAALRVWRSNGD